MVWIGVTELIAWAVFWIVLIEKAGPRVADWLVAGINERDEQLKKLKERNKK